MTAPTTDLAAALTAAIAHVELVARLADDGPWKVAEQTHGDWYGIHSDHFALGSLFDLDNARHIALNDPVRVLARCAADREIVGMHGARHVGGACYEDDAEVPCWTLRLLARGYGVEVEEPKVDGMRCALGEHPDCRFAGTCACPCHESATE